jgi:hypothetical protein
MTNTRHVRVFIRRKNDDDTYSVIPNPEIEGWNDLYPCALEVYHHTSQQDGMSIAVRRHTYNGAGNVVLSLNRRYGNRHRVA